MPLPSPKVDPRTYTELVASAEWLAQCFTGYGFLILKSPLWELPPDWESLSIKALEPLKIEFITISSADDLPPNEEPNKVIVGKIGDSYHIRIFDKDKKQIFDVGKGEFSPGESLRKFLENVFHRKANNQSIPTDSTVKDLLRQLAFPKEGKGLVIVGKDRDSYHLRIFDWAGKQVVDKKIVDEGKDESTHNTILRKQLQDSFDCQLNNQSIDDQTKSKLLKLIQASVGLTLDFQWIPPEDKTDAGRALIRIFGRMASMVTDRLNRVPEKHFLAFLNLIGAQQQPPQPARVPLTAYLVDNSPVGAIVPAHTQITAVSQPGETEEVLFETQEDLVVMRSQLQAAIVHRGKQYCDHRVTATTATGDFSVFEIEQPNTLYIAADQLTTKIDSQEIQLAISNSGNLKGWNWSYWNGEIWQILSTKGVDDKLQLTQPESAPKEWKPPKYKIIEGTEAQWLRGIAPGTLLSPAEIRLIRAETGAIVPDQAFFNTDEIDLSKDFFPLGETPRFNDTFYIASQSLLSIGKSTITINLSKSDPYPFTATISKKKISTPQPSEDVQLQWEAWNGTAWEKISQPNPSNLNDLVAVITLPDQVAPVEVNGEENYWLRARLIAGNYGSEPRFETKTQPTEDATKTKSAEDATKTTTTILEQVAGYFPPSLKSLTLSRSEIKNIAPKEVLNALPSGAFVHPDADTFPLHQEDGLYLGFDRPFPNQSIALYLQIAPSSPGELLKSNPAETPAKLKWEYYGVEAWRSLSVQDGTQNLSQRGMVQFVGPSDFASQALFGRSGYWLRLRLQEGDFQIQPRLQQVLTNTVWAIQATTYQDEVLGSGTGNPSLVLRILHTPILLGQQLLVREPELPSAEEQIAIKKLEGNNAIAISTDASGQPEDIWVRWHEVSDFYASGSRDRHYILDRMIGEIRFGGEGQGMAPPIGRNNIRMARYQSGGGRQGNCGVGTLTALKTTVPYVNRVTNHEPANGGADLESIAVVQESAPKQLRHRDRAVTWQDIEDLTYAASSEIARVKVITPKFDPVVLPWIPNADEQPLPPEGLAEALQQAGTATVLIVPHSPALQPTPSLALIEQVKRYLGDRTSPSLKLQVTEPFWVKVTVTATIAPVSFQAANSLEAAVKAALTDFLHPLTGDTRGRGWSFGRNPHESDLYARIERIPGVSHVESLSIASPIANLATDNRDRFLIYSGQHQITISSPP
ncbi:MULTISPECIES: putative baseplate assembly protein [Cyanophyceae]|uniref:Baseplate assembly protein n=1 Tax=Leptolyngbya subtilissima DQ-A4 TaxID=2933933 RepID=A0ABV0JZK3_9CYAN|nr:putative baseplate assembly protein [Nodosilinea sp. FACHB-141]MBD2112583.1 putative baseplate assembly protein [Nodosilinea sp. FACHB-141]